MLAHDNLRFLDTTATVKADCPFANCRVAFDATVWSPQVGMKLCPLLYFFYRACLLNLKV